MMKAIMKQAQEMQKKIQEEQKKLETMEIEGISGGGMVKVVLTGKSEMKKLNIDKSLINVEEADILEDLIIAAFNDAKIKIDKISEDNMGKLTGGLNLGGMKFPF